MNALDIRQLPTAFAPWTDADKLYARTTLAGCLGLLKSLDELKPLPVVKETIEELERTLGL